MTEEGSITQYYLKLVERDKKTKERVKKYHQDHREEDNARCKNNYYKNHEAELQRRAELRQDEEYKLMMEKYRQSEAGKKSARISGWKQWGIINDDYDALYEKWKNTTHCEACDVELIEGNKGKHKKVIDHDHKTGAFRNIVCNSCNVKRGNDDRGVVKQTKAQYNENRKWKRWEQDFRLKWDLKKGFNSFK